MKIKLGELIEQYSVKNTKNSYSINDVVGISTSKYFISTKANLDGVSLSSYKIVKPNHFAFVPDTSRRGDKISLAFNSTQNTFLVSSISVVFSVKNTEKLLPFYLFLYFNRPEFDRYSRFHSWGSAREAFSWEDMCNIELDLPDIAIQQKYVAVYQALLANQQAYEKGLDDLTLVCDGNLDKFKSQYSFIKVKELLKEVDNRNSNKKIDDLQGINILKEFMPSVANVGEENLSKYKIVKKHQFAYSAMQTGRDKCIRIALYNQDKPCIISPAYSVLEVKNNNVLAEYIMLWFSRKESDRYGWFVSDSSIRASLELSSFYEIEIPLPPISVQQAIVDIYKVLLDRRAINDTLKQQIKAICPVLVRGAVAEMAK